MVEGWNEHRVLYIEGLKMLFDGLKMSYFVYGCLENGIMFTRVSKMLGYTGLSKMPFSRHY